MNFQEIVQRYWREQPIVFPFVALFHFYLLLRFIFTMAPYFDEPAYLAQGVWLLTATVLAVFICSMRRWANVGYILLTMAGLLLAYLFPVAKEWKELDTVLFPFDLLMCVFLLFYYKRFR